MRLGQQVLVRGLLLLRIGNVAADLSAQIAVCLRERETGKPVCELPNTGPGDAIFFRISDKLQHIVTQVESEAPKTAFAGWFGSIDTVHRLLLEKTAARKDA